MGTASMAITTGWLASASPWNANSSTSVSSSAEIEYGPSAATARSSRPAPRDSSRLRSPCASMTGITMYSATEAISVSHGTAIADRPSSSATIGAKATIMMASFSATCDSVK